MPQATAPRVFISYSHDGATHEDRVLELTNQLRNDGIDAIVDQYEQSPPQGWPAWCELQIEEARFVLMVCTETYFRRVRGDETPSEGYGVHWEARLIRQYLYDAGSAIQKFVPVLLEGGSPDYIPKLVKGQSFFRVDTREGYDALLHLLTGQPLKPMPPVGQRRPLPTGIRPAGRRADQRPQPIEISTPDRRTEDSFIDRQVQPALEPLTEASEESVSLPPQFTRPPVFLSASIPLADRHSRYSHTADVVSLLDAINALALVVLPVTGIVLAGHPGIVSLISAVAQLLPSIPSRIVVFQSGWFVKSVPMQIGTPRTVVVPEAATLMESLEHMRTAMIHSYHFAEGVFIGGMEGVEQEYEMFLQYHPRANVFPIASTGAAAANIYDTGPSPPGGWDSALKNDRAYLPLFRRLLRM